MVSFAVYSTMNKSKSARLAEIDANIQACMRELDGLRAGMVGESLNTTVVSPGVVNTRSVGVPRKSVMAVPIISSSSGEK